MTGRLAVDFGTSNTVLALWDETLKQGIPLHIPEYGQIQRQANREAAGPGVIEPGAQPDVQPAQGDPENEGTVSVIPSLIHYELLQPEPGGETEVREWIGSQVIQRGVRQSNQTFRWMKRYITSRSPNKIRINGREITPFTAGQDFLSAVLGIARSTIDLRDEEVAFSVPVEAFEHYENWLVSVAEKAEIRRFRLIDEPSAAALGYGAHIQPGNVYLLFDFGGGTMHAAVVLIEAEEKAMGGRRCRVLGKAGRDIGGTSIDQWIFQDVLRQNHRPQTVVDEVVQQISTALLVECERVKETLSFYDHADLSMVNPRTGTAVAADFTRSSFEDLLDEHDLFTEINQTINTAVNTATERGYDEDSIKAVLMVGGSSQIPSVQKALRHRFGRERVLFNRPLDAVARGAAAFVAGMDFYDHIQHDYAIRYRNSETRLYDFRTIVRRGTAYPTNEPVARLTVKASVEEQARLGIAIFELGEHRPSSQPVELVFDPSGAARITRVTADEQEKRSMFWMNEEHQTFLIANPPASPGESRFDVEFQIDSNKRLTITARDLKTGSLILKDVPVVKLT